MLAPRFGQRLRSRPQQPGNLVFDWEMVPGLGLGPSLLLRRFNEAQSLDNS
jgi:hypothetical protein